MDAPTELERLYDVAGDYELEVLEGLAVKAGLRWVCGGDDEVCFGWTNLDTDETCQRCDTPRS